MRSVGLYLVWTLVGFIASFEVLYAFTPIGLAIAVAVVAAFRFVPRIEGRRSPEAWGLLLGFGAFWAFVGTTVDGDPLAFYLVGVAAAVLATGWYLAGGRVRSLAG